MVCSPHCGKHPASCTVLSTQWRRPSTTAPNRFNRGRRPPPNRWPSPAVCRTFRRAETGRSTVGRRGWPNRTIRSPHRRRSGGTRTVGDPHVGRPEADRRPASGIGQAQELAPGGFGVAAPPLPGVEVGGSSPSGASSGVGSPSPSGSARARRFSRPGRTSSARSFRSPRSR